MPDISLTPELSKKIADLYARMETAYDRVAKALYFSCEGCQSNCCDSFFQHHTYIEWAYLWEGLNTLPEGQRELLLQRAATYVAESEELLAKGDRPAIMCPLNENGLCSLYSHRLMICRMHGVPSEFTRPDGRKMSFPGCFRCQELIGETTNPHVVDRTELYRELAGLETTLLGSRRYILPRVKLTLAQMMVQGPPSTP